MKGIFKDPNSPADDSKPAVPIIADADGSTELPATSDVSQADPDALAVDTDSAAVPTIPDGGESTESPVAASKPQRWQSLSRTYIPQPIPLDGTDSQTNSQPSLLEDIRIAYIFQAPMIRGKFDNNKAKQLGVPNGPIRGKLTAGQAIEFDDPANPGQKKVIKPEDVVGAAQDGGVSFPAVELLTMINIYW